MLIRRLAGFVGVCVALWMMWETVRAVQFLLAGGSDIASALLSPPTTVMRLVSTTLMILGGLLAAMVVRGGAWLFGAGAIVFAAMTALMAMTADYTLWRDEAILAPFLLVIAGVLTFCHRHPQPAAH